MTCLLARGLFGTWRKAPRETRRQMLRDARQVPPGDERRAALRFLEMVETYQRTGEVTL